MAACDVLNLAGKKVSQIELSDEIFKTEIKPHLFWEVVRYQLAKRRAGTAKTKSRSEVRGGGRKPFRQKGTGRARQGSIRSPIMVGGSVAHGPQPRDYGYTLPKKVRRAALCSALSLRLKDEQLVIVEDFELSEVKTKKLRQTLSDLNVKKALLVDFSENETLRLSCRNLADFQVLPPIGLNVYDLLRYEHLVLTKRAVEAIEQRLTS